MLQLSVSFILYFIFPYTLFCLFVCFSTAQPWDSSTSLPCSDTIWERWIVQQLQGPFIVDACQCPFAGQWHVRWMFDPAPLSLQITCTVTALQVMHPATVRPSYVEAVGYLWSITDHSTQSTFMFLLLHLFILCILVGKLPFHFSVLERKLRALKNVVLCLGSATREIFCLLVM